MNISEIALKDGRIINPSNKINLIIGANNTGKSTFIKELSDSIKNKYIDINQSKWFSNIKLIQKSPKDRLLNLFKNINELENLNEIPPELFNEKSGYSPSGRSRLNLNKYEVNFLSGYVDDNQQKEINIKIGTSQNHSVNPSTGEDIFLKIITNAEVCDEFCDSRLQGTFDTTINNLLLDNNGDNSIARHLFTNRALFRKIQKNIYAVFGEKIGFDNLQQGEKHIRIINKAGTKKNYTPEWWRDNCPYLAKQGDGIRAYTKIITSLLDEDYGIIFIDEPEAFLHPPQRKALGKFIAEFSKTSNKQVFIATHDAEFIRGILLGTKKESNEIAIFRTISSDSSRRIEEFTLSSLSGLIQQTKTIHPTKAAIYNELFLNSLFFKKTILTENECDKIVYEYFASLYLYDFLTDVNFIGLNGKTTVKDIFDEMHKMSVNVSCIFDFDFLFNTDAVPSCIDKNLRQKHNAFSKKIFSEKTKQEVEQAKKQIKKQGVSFFKNNESLYNECNEIISEYSTNGIYVVPVGELESWFNVGHGNLHGAIEKIEKTKRHKSLKSFIEKIIK